MDNALKTVAHKTKLQEWTERVQECRSSGIPVKDWCKEHEIKVSTFYAWQKKVFNSLSAELQLNSYNATTIFAEITQDLHVAADSANIAATLRAGDFSIDIYDNASATFIENMFRGLKSC